METPEKTNKTPTKLPKRPRKRRYAKHETIAEKSLPYFDQTTERLENGVSKVYYGCQLCGKEICGNNLTNLGSHLLNKHRDVYVQHIGSVKESIHIKRLKLLQNCVSIVGLDGRPFAALSDHGFQEIISNKISKIQKAGLSIDLKSSNQPDVHAHMHSISQKMRDAIKIEVKNRPISILLDIGTRQRRSFLGISIQFIAGSDVQIRSIGVIELTKRHTAANLAEYVKECLSKFDIKKRQIISITTDNGPNVLKLVRDLRDFLNDDLINRPKVAVELNFSSTSDADIDKDIATILSFPDITNDEALDLIFDEDELEADSLPNHETLLNAVVDELMTDDDLGEIFNMNGVNCAAHTVQLAIKDALAALPESIRNVISISRRIAKILNLKTTQYDLAAANIPCKIPHLEVETRWGSMYTMVSTKTK